MNATEEGEPLGDGPIDTLTAIKRGAVLGMLSAADEVLATKQLAERQGQALNVVRELHSPSYAGGELGPFCDMCEESVGPYPCPTILAIDEAGA